VKKEYIEYDQSRGHPIGDDLYYECVRCNGLVASLPDEPDRCTCGNLRKDYSRLGCWEGGDKAMRLVRLTKGESNSPGQNFKLREPR